MVAPEDIEAARAAAAADSRNVPGLMQIADRLLHAGDPAQATELARAAMGYAPDDAGVWMSAAAILGVVGDVPAALEAEIGRAHV